MTAANRPSLLSDTAPPKQKRLVLLVDDSAAQRRLLARLLKRGGYDVIEAANGAEALQLCERLAPDLVLGWPAAALHGAQIGWAAEQAASLQEYFRRKDPAAVVDGTWPVHPRP